MSGYVDNDDTDIENLSDSFVNAQKEAELEVEEKLSAENVLDDQNAPLVVPKLLQLGSGIEEMKEKTNDLKRRGEQLDLLLLKAESYSHFIKANQERFDLNKIPHNPAVSTTSPDSNSKKNKNSSSSSSSSSKKRKASLPLTTSSSTISDISPSSESDIIDPRQPVNLMGGKLLPYQIDGLQWMASLWENGLSGILADEMGLGKTIQVISLIAHLRLRTVMGPFLIAAPLATLHNWLNEFRKWLPSCPCVLYHGDKAEREEIRKSFYHHKDNNAQSNRKESFSVVITSFEICIIDRPHLDRYSWQFLIIDEGHRIKNRNCRLVKELKLYSTTSRLLLTGTPIQNSLDELWSLLNFVNPTIFDDLEVFQSWFGFKNIGKDTQVDEIIGTEKQERVVSKLHEILRPFLLRRMKRDVFLNMPPKKEIVIYCGMSTLQKDYYSRISQGTLRETLMNLGIEGSENISQINMTMNYRKICNHPFLFGEPRETNGAYLGDARPQLLVMASGKFKLLDRMLPRLNKEGHKVLIFSQMTKLMDILQDYSEFKGYKYCRLDGSTDRLRRQEMIDDFNRDPNTFIFFLSTRAGGQGLNLASADTVILFDSDWNPHMDSQAEARCHRIGQSKPVVTYRLVTAGSVEIDMMEKQISKKKLERLTIAGGDFRKAGERSGSNLTISRLRQLLEDDVNNMSRNEVTGEDISDKELDMILNRGHLFGNWGQTRVKSTQINENAPCGLGEKESYCDIHSEGLMYDIVTSDDSAALGAVG